MLPFYTWAMPDSVLCKRQRNFDGLQHFQCCDKFNNVELYFNQQPSALPQPENDTSSPVCIPFRCCWKRLYLQQFPSISNEPMCFQRRTMHHKFAIATVLQQSVQLHKFFVVCYGAFSAQQTVKRQICHCYPNDLIHLLKSAKHYVPPKCNGIIVPSMKGLLSTAQSDLIIFRQLCSCRFFYDYRGSR